MPTQPCWHTIVIVIVILCAFTIKAGFCLFFLLFFLPLVLLKLLAPLLPLLPPLVLGLPHVTTAAVATSATGSITIDFSYEFNLVLLVSTSYG